jgi:transposase
MTPHRRPHRKAPVSRPSLLERVNPKAAGIDCGADTHYVAVPPDRDATPVRAFTTFTADLPRLAD